MIIMQNYAAFELLSGSPFESNYQLPLVGVSCNSGASNISECQLYNQTNNCNHQKTVGVLCKGKVLYNYKIRLIWYMHATACETLLYVSMSLTSAVAI